MSIPTPPSRGRFIVPTADLSAPAPARTSLVHLGRQDFMSVMFRLVGMELYKLRRRMMSKVLAIISVLAVVVVFLLLGLLSAIESTHTTSVLLRLPLSLYVTMQIAFTLGRILIVILVGVIVGAEYSAGTIRLMFTRGPSRTQFLLSKIGVAICCIVIGVLGITLITIPLGEVLNLLTGVGTTQQSLRSAFQSSSSAAWVGHALLYLLITMLGLFVYAMMALFLATLARSTAAGIAGVLVWALLIEPVLGAVFNGVASITNGATADFLRAIPNYFIGNNVSALQQNQEVVLFPGSLAQLAAQANPSPLSDAHALLVLAGYLILFIGLAWWINERRDITN
jgi:ABC-type transport system involved in multi-copper enzyme maturation permease subunit